jgi:hypothetical protein
MTKKRPRYSLKNMPKVLDDEEFIRVWFEWMAFRKETKHPLTPIAVHNQLLKLMRMGRENAIRSIEQSIERGYRGLFEVNGFTGQRPTGGRDSEYYRDQLKVRRVSQEDWTPPTPRPEGRQG